MQLFPSEAGGVPEHQGANVKEIVRVFSDEATTKEKSPVSITQNSGSTSSKGLGPVDVSETYRRRTGELSAQSAPDASRQPSDPISPLPRPGGRPEPEGSRFITPRLQRTSEQQFPKFRDPSLARIPILIVIAVALAIATYLLRFS
jgi:hypothetical protein